MTRIPLQQVETVRSHICGHCRWWAQTERTEAIEHSEAECRKRAPLPAPVSVHAVAVRRFPITMGVDGCGDFAYAGPEVYRADYREELGPWIEMAVLWGPRR